MGLFDDLLKRVDNGLKAVESGTLEKRLNQFADAVEKKSNQVDSTLHQTATKPGEALEVAERKKEAVETKAQQLGEHAKRGLNEIRKKD